METAEILIDVINGDFFIKLVSAFLSKKAGERKFYPRGYAIYTQHFKNGILTNEIGNSSPLILKYFSNNNAPICQ